MWLHLPRVEFRLHGDENVGLREAMNAIGDYQDVDIAADSAAAFPVNITKNHNGLGSIFATIMTHRYN